MSAAESRTTILLAVAALVASTAHVVAVPPSKLEPVRYDPRVSVCGVLAVMVILAEPSKLVPFMVLAVANLPALFAYIAFTAP